MYSYVQIGTYVFLHKHNVDIYNTQKYIATCIHKKKHVNKNPLKQMHLHIHIYLQLFANKQFHIYICTFISAETYIHTNIKM